MAIIILAITMRYNKNATVQVRKITSIKTRQLCRESSSFKDKR
jgi:hypothetical protein